MLGRYTGGWVGCDRGLAQGQQHRRSGQQHHCPCHAKLLLRRACARQAEPEMACIAENLNHRAPATRQKKSGGAFRRRRQSFSRVIDLVGVEFARNVVEGAAQLVADVAHSGNRGNGDEGGNQAVLNRGRTLNVLDQLKKLGHLWSPSGSTKGSTFPPPPRKNDASDARRITTARVEKALKVPVSRR